MHVPLCNLGLLRMTMGREIEPQQHVEKNKFLNHLDEAFGFMCTHISQDLFFHLEGLRTPKKSCVVSTSSLLSSLTKFVYQKSSRVSRDGTLVSLRGMLGHAP